MRRVTKPLFGLIAACSIGFASVAYAQAEPEKAPRDVEKVIASDEYKDLVKEGMLKYTRGFWPEARAYFLKAHELAPNARTLRGLALVSYDSRHYVDAIDYAEQSLAHPVQPLGDKMAEELKQLVAQAHKLIGHVELVTTPSAAELRVDGARVARRGDGSLWLDPGEHELSVAAAGYVSETRRLQTDAERSSRVEIALRSATVAPVRVAVKPAQPHTEQRSALPWVVVGISGAVAAAGGVMLALDQSSSDGKSSAFTPLGGALLGVGAVGVIIGITWSLSPRTDAAPGTAQLQLSPFGTRLHGTF
ncbi:MAG TPA: tetratricopeptide repeat protein [Polyangiales bacterium]|nr:tetratricopeptide repeat protein [Polyangiales bacterium]